MTLAVDRCLDMIAEAKMHFILAAQGTRPGTPERAKALEDLERCAKKAREYVDTHGGIDALPEPLAVSLRVSEMGLEKLRAQEPS